MFFSFCFLFIRSIVFFLIQSHLFTYFSRFSSLAVNFLFFSYCLFFFTVDFSSPAVRGKVYRLFVFLFAPFFTFFLTQFIVFFFFLYFFLHSLAIFFLFFCIFSPYSRSIVVSLQSNVFYFFFSLLTVHFSFFLSVHCFFFFLHILPTVLFFSLCIFSTAYCFFFCIFFFSLLTVHFCSPAVREEVRPAECRQEAAPQVQPLEGEVC